MIERLTKPEYLCYLALAAASRSEDSITRVGAIIVNKDWRIINTGTNGVKAGQEYPEKWNLEENRGEKGDIIFHAENSAFKGLKDEPYAIGLTMSPCFACSKLIASQGIQQVYYIKEYERDIEKKFKQVFDFYKVGYEQMSKFNLNRIMQYMMKDVENLNNLINIEKNSLGYEYEILDGFQNCAKCGIRSVQNGIVEKYRWFCKKCS